MLCSYLTERSPGTYPVIPPSEVMVERVREVSKSKTTNKLQLQHDVHVVVCVAKPRNNTSLQLVTHACIATSYIAAYTLYVQST